MLQSRRISAWAISLWANAHKSYARFILVIAHIFLVVFAFLLASFFREWHWRIPAFVVGLAVVGSAVTALVYLAIQNQPKRKNYYLRKKLDMILVACGFLMMVCAVNGQLRRDVVSDTPARAFSLQVTHKTQTYRKVPNDQLHEKPARRISTVGKILLTLLVVFGVVVAGYGIVALACGLSCSGYEALAILVALLGTFGVVLLAVLGLSAIFSGPRRAKRVAERLARRKARRAKRS